MKRAKLLLKASRTMIGDSNSIALGLFTAIVWVFAAFAIGFITYCMTLYKTDPKLGQHLAIGMIEFSPMVIGYGMARSFYTGFIEVRKNSGKSSFMNFAMQLPVTKEDVIKAQFLDLLRCALPGFLVLCYTLVFTVIYKADKIILMYSGALVLFFNILFLLICLDKGIFTYIFISSKVREIIYISFALLSIFVISNNAQQKIQNFVALGAANSNLKILSVFSSFLVFLGGEAGFISLLLTVLIGWYLSCHLPAKIFRLKEGRK